MRTRIEAENVKLKRVYESPSAEDGTRILVERLWSRGIKKADAAIDQWARGISPSTELRKWFAHDPDHWQEFRRRYAEEVREHPEGLSELRALARQGRITLVFSAHDEIHNNAIVLRDLLLGRQTKGRPGAQREKSRARQMPGIERAPKGGHSTKSGRSRFPNAASSIAISRTLRTSLVFDSLFLFGRRGDADEITRVGVSPRTRYITEATRARKEHMPQIKASCTLRPLPSCSWFPRCPNADIRAVRSGCDRQKG